MRPVRLSQPRRRLPDGFVARSSALFRGGPFGSRDPEAGRQAPHDPLWTDIISQSSSWLQGCWKSACSVAAVEDKKRDEVDGENGSGIGGKGGGGLSNLAGPEGWEGADHHFASDVTNGWTGFLDDP